MDWPGELAAVLFVAGCPWRCAYCHNTHLQRRQPAVDMHALWPWLQQRVGRLDGVVFSGGEPLVDPALPQAMAEVQSLGFKIGLHTAGCYPERLKDCLPWLDWCGLDIKHHPQRYPEVTGVADSITPVQRCLTLLRSSGVPFECRTTCRADLHSAEDIEALAHWLAGQGVTHYAVQEARAAVGEAETWAPVLDAERQAHLQSCFQQFTYRAR